MTTFIDPPSRNRDIQDLFERQIFGSITYGKAGGIVKTRGTLTRDEEAPVLSLGIGFTYPDDTNTEVFLLSHGSDTTQKYALISIPRDKQRAWKKGTGGVQHPLDPKRALEFNEKRTFLDDGNYATRNGTFEVKDGDIYVRGNIYCTGQVIANMGYVGPDIHNDVGQADIPGFEA